MLVAICSLKSLTPYSQSKPIIAERLKNESADEQEKRIWRERIHVDVETGNAIIPPMVFKNCINEAAGYAKMKIQGKGNSTYKQKFLSGVMVLEGINLNIRPADVIGESFFMSARGIKGNKGGGCVWRTYPVFPKWSGVVEYWISDPDITEQVFRDHLTVAGSFIGIGRFRPQNGGFYGRFAVENIKFEQRDIL